jgi:hypothetical protein
VAALVTEAELLGTTGTVSTLWDRSASGQINARNDYVSMFTSVLNSFEATKGRQPGRPYFGRLPASQRKPCMSAVFWRTTAFFSGLECENREGECAYQQREAQRDNGDGKSRQHAGQRAAARCHSGRV